MDDLSAVPLRSLIVELALRCLRGPDQDEHLGAIAIELLARAGGAAVPLLAREAAERTNSARHRLRALLAIQQIGLVDIESSIELFPLIHDSNALIRIVACEILRRYCGEATDMSDLSLHRRDAARATGAPPTERKCVAMYGPS
jgi:hypothetical protein